MSMLFPPIGQVPEPGERPHPQGLISMLGQGRWWKTRDAGWMRIKDMHPTHRTNTAALLMRQAAELASRVSWIEFATLDRWLAFGMGEMAADAVENEMAAWDEQRTADPQAWMASTKLYRSLTRPHKRDTERFGTPRFPEGTPERGPQFIGGVEYP